MRIISLRFHVKRSNTAQFTNSTAHYKMQYCSFMQHRGLKRCMLFTGSLVSEWCFAQPRHSTGRALQLQMVMDILESPGHQPSACTPSPKDHLLGGPKVKKKQKTSSAAFANNLLRDTRQGDVFPPVAVNANGPTIQSVAHRPCWS